MHGHGDGTAVTPEALHPTAYTAALLHQLRARAGCVDKRSVLEIGTGSGVVLATLLTLGAEAATGVDVEPLAVACTRRLLAAQGLATRARIHLGNLWAPLQGQRFDLIAANLPQFPLEQAIDDGRLPTWSGGGPDGRAAVEPFLQGLPRHLAPGGLAVMTHNAFIDLPLTHERLAALGMQATVASTVCVPLARHKLDGLPRRWLDRFEGCGLHRLGDFAFADFHVLEIRHRQAATPLA